MSGKAALFLILGFSTIFAVMSKNLLDYSNDATDNYVQYYSASNAHNIATSGANMAVSQLFFNKYWVAGFNYSDIMGGSLTVTVDTVGAENRKITSTAIYRRDTAQTIVMLTPKNFAQYGNFYNIMGSVWAATGDTFSGPFHTNDYLNCYGDPVFLGYTTTKNGYKLYDKNSHPKFLGGYEDGVDVPLEFDTSTIRVAAYSNGKIITDPTLKNKVIDVKLTFNDDGTLTHSESINGGTTWTSPINENLKTYAPNGVIYVERGNIFVQGTLSGQATIVASQKGTPSAGMIHITGDVVYKNNPLVNPNSTDMLGMVAEKNVQLDFDATRGDVNIQASMYTQKDGLVIERLDDYTSAHKMNILGGVIGQNIRETARYKWDGTKYVVVKGYSYVHKFDQRFLTTVPPFFPKTKYYKILSWLE